MRPALLLAALALVPAFSLPAPAGESAWTDVAPDVALRLISSGEVHPDGRIFAALEIDMPATTKTYWRVPGETGIPTELDLSRSVGILAHEVHWPYPLVEEKGGLVDYAYYGRTVLPIEITLAGETGELDLTATLGICSEICVPVRARLVLPLGGPPDPGNALRIRQALASVPLDWTEGGPAIRAVRFDAGRDALAVELGAGGVDPFSLVGALGEGGPLLGPSAPDPAGSGVLLPLIGKTRAGDLVGRPIDLVFMTTEGPYRVTSAVEAD